MEAHVRDNRTLHPMQQGHAKGRAGLGTHGNRLGWNGCKKRWGCSVSATRNTQHATCNTQQATLRGEVQPCSCSQAPTSSVGAPARGLALLLLKGSEGSGRRRLRGLRGGCACTDHSRGLVCNPAPQHSIQRVTRGYTHHITPHYTSSHLTHDVAPMEGQQENQAAGQPSSRKTKLQDTQQQLPQQAHKHTNACTYAHTERAVGTALPRHGAP